MLIHGDRSWCHNRSAEGPGDGGGITGFAGWGKAELGGNGMMASGTRKRG